MRYVWLILAVCCAASPAPSFAAEDEGDALLRRVAAAAARLTYSGVFVYRSGDRQETSRIAHSAEGGRQRERIEVLDGSPREILRENGEVKCFLPDEKLLIVENQSRHRGFPAVLPSGGGVPDHYVIRRTSVGRVAGIDAQAIVLEPRDVYRYGHELWVDPVSGMLLKASLLGDKGETLETFAFTQLRLGGPLEEGALSPKFDPKQVKVRKVDASDLPLEKTDWRFRNDLPGFRQQAVMRRQSRLPGREALHVVFSDGLAAISVFMEPVTKNMEDGVVRIGPTHVYRRKIDAYQAIVMGEVPAAAVQHLGSGIERRRR